MMAVGGSDNNDDFEAASRRFWGAWSEGMTGSGGQANAWQDGLQQWMRVLSVDAPLDMEALLRSYGQPGGDWFTAMQGVAARFAGKDTTAAEVAAAWRQALKAQMGGQWGGLFAEPAAEDVLAGFSKMFAQSPLAQAWTEMPAFGPAREHQARWQAWVKAQQRYQAQAQAYQQQIRSVFEDAFALFEQRLQQHESPDAQLQSARAMFDLWIEVAEEAYAKVATSEQFQQIYGEMANAHMQVRAAAQHELERSLHAAGLPTRSEMDAAHRKIAELERALHKLSRTAAPVATHAGASSSGAPKPSRTAAKPPARKSTARKVGGVAKSRSSAATAKPARTPEKAADGVVKKGAKRNAAKA